MRDKACFKCLATKSLDAYYKHPKMADGHLNKCKECTKRDTINARRLNLEYYREYDRERSCLPKRVKMRKQVAERRKNDPDLRDRDRMLKAEWQKRNPEKGAAHHAVNNAVRDGRLVKLACERCGNPDSEGHHDDYTKPLDVIWLCPRHHAERHKELRAIARMQTLA
jgi:hypothetical protein